METGTQQQVSDTAPVSRHTHLPSTMSHQQASFTLPVSVQNIGPLEATLPVQQLLVADFAQHVAVDVGEIATVDFCDFVVDVRRTPAGSA